MIGARLYIIIRFVAVLEHLQRVAGEEAGEVIGVMRRGSRAFGRMIPQKAANIPIHHFNDNSYSVEHRRRLILSIVIYFSFFQAFFTTIICQKIPRRSFFF